MKASLNVPASKLLQFQGLVKAHNLRFLGNPLVIGEVAHVSIDGNHVSQDVCNQFFQEWDRMNRPIREITSPSWKRFLRKFGFPV